jgi:hypothetical protein
MLHPKPRSEERGHSSDAAASLTVGHGVSDHKRRHDFRQAPDTERLRPVTDLAAAVDRFRAAAEASGVTPKGAQVLKLARPAAGASFRQVFVAGNRQSREQVDAFFREQGLSLRCLAVSDLVEAEDPPGIVAFSVMRRDVFEKLIDPWPSPSTLFVGYDFEIDCYRRRLARREALRASLLLDEERRSQVTGLPRATFADPSAQSDKPPAAPEPDDKLVHFDRATRDWNWTRRITVPRPRQDEEVCQARMVHFVGRSWSAMTDDHRSVMLSQGASGTSVHHVRLDELVRGSHLIVRESGDRDVIRLLAEQRKGEAAYRQLRERASLWRTALRASSQDVRSIIATLRSTGVHRHPATVRAWLADGEGSQRADCADRADGARDPLGRRDRYRRFARHGGSPAPSATSAGRCGSPTPPSASSAGYRAHALDIRRHRAVAAEQPMPPEQPQIARQ